MTPEENPLDQFDQTDIETATEATSLDPVAIAEAIALMVERNAVTISKAQALAHKRHAGLAIHYHPDGHVECLVTHTVATGEVEHYYVVQTEGGSTVGLLPVEIEDES